MSDPQTPCESPCNSTVWGAQLLSRDALYRRIGDTLYAELHTGHAADLAAIPAPALRVMLLLLTTGVQ